MSLASRYFGNKKTATITVSAATREDALAVALQVLGHEVVDAKVEKLERGVNGRPNLYSVRVTKQ